MAKLGFLDLMCGGRALGWGDRGLGKFCSGGSNWLVRISIQKSAGDFTPHGVVIENASHWTVLNLAARYGG
jgi:hypothetical protein